MLKFAGQPLLFPDAKVDAFMDRNLEMIDLQQFSEVQARTASARHACRSRFEQNKGLGLPIINWPAPPIPRLNTLYWPTGASRWARGWFIATRDAMKKMITATRGTSQNELTTKPALLQFGDAPNPPGKPPLDPNDPQRNGYVQCQMFMLPPRQITGRWQNGDQQDGDLWLIPLVDERYFWQYANAGDLVVDKNTTWQQLITKLETALNMKAPVRGSIEAAYLKPDPTDFSRRYDNAALLLDAVVSSIGKRFIHFPLGNNTIDSWSIADAALIANYKIKSRLLGGGGAFSQNGGDLPEKVTVTFRKIKQHLLRNDNQLYTETGDKPASKTYYVKGTKHTIHCAAYADYDTNDTLKNGTALKALQAQILKDYYAWAKEDYDLNYAGTMPWTMTGYDDAVLWAFGRTCPDRSFQLVHDEHNSIVGIDDKHEPLAYTRVQTLPPNCWPELNLCSDSTKEVVEPRLYAKANEDISAGGEGHVSLYDSFTHDTGKDVLLTNISSAEWKSGKGGWAEGIGDAVWLGTPSECEEQQ